MTGRSSATYSAYKIVALSASASVIPTTRGLNVQTAGTADITDADGNAVAGYYLQAGYNPIQISKLTALGTASGVWALY
jgi:ABC-type uncharacterized transport system permease subunit